MQTLQTHNSASMNRGELPFRLTSVGTTDEFVVMAYTRRSPVVARHQ